MARRPGRVALVATLICALTGVGFVRYAVSAGPELLVGQNSDAKQVYDRFAAQFGSDPVVIVLAARNPTAFYIERNLLRLGALESDLAKDPRVATVLGLGTIAGSAELAAEGEVGKVLTEYPFFVGETALATAINRGETNNDNLTKIEQDAYKAAQLALVGSVIKATQDADTARDAFTKQAAGSKSTDAPRFLRLREQAAEKAASATQPPPLFSQYLAGPTGKADDAAAQGLFDRLTAGFGDCSSDIAQALKIQPSCQVFLERLLLDLPSCPATAAPGVFCPPKNQWSAVVPQPRKGGINYAVITLRLKPEVVGHADQVNALLARVRAELNVGRPHDQQQVVQQLKGFAPRECGGEPNPDTQSSCYQHYHDDPVDYTIAGAPLLVQGVVGTMSHLLLALFPVAFLLMMLLLLGTFRVTGRLWPLVAAGGAVLLTIAGGLLLGVPITPAVLAGVPVLAGLGVDYAVQLVARLSEERRRGLGIEAALRLTLGNTGPATLAAAGATLAGLLVLAALTFFDAGPLVAVPLVAEFALVLCAGVVFSWLAALFIALPAAAWTERRREARLGREAVSAATVEPPPADAPRTRALASRWRAVLIPAALLALVGWALLPRVHIETSVERLLAPGLSEVQDIDTVRAQLGYDNEIDFAVEGKVAGSDAKAAVPGPVTWMAAAGLAARCDHPGDVAIATTIGDVFTAQQSGSGTACPGSSPTPTPTPGVSPTPSPSGSASPASSPSASSSPTALRGEASPSPGPRVDGDVVRIGNVLAATAVASPSPAPSASAVPSPSASGAAASPLPSGTPAPSTSRKTPLQTQFLCDLRLLAPLSRNLVAPIQLGAAGCPARDLFRNVFINADPSPIDPNLARIALGVQLTSVADQAKLIDQLTSEYDSSLHQQFGNNPPIKVAPTGLTALAAQAYDNLSGRVLIFNLVPLFLVGLVLLAVFKHLRRALLPLLPAVLAAGWSPLVVLLLGRLPGDAGATLGTFNPLTVVLGALVIALGTEFGVVLLQRFYEERAAGSDPDTAAAVALRGVGRAIVVSALTLGAGFAVLAVSGLFPGGLPLIADFGLEVVVDLTLAVAAVFLVMLPLAVAIERAMPLELPAPVAADGGFRPRTAVRPQQQQRPAAGRGKGQRPVRPERAPGRAAAAVAEREPVEALEAQESDLVETSTAVGRPFDEPAATAVPQLEEAGPGEDRAAEPAPPQGDEALAAPPPAGPAAGSRRFPGMSGRRHAAPPEPVAAEPPAPAAAAGPSALPPAAPARLPGMSGRRRGAGTGEPPAVPPAPPAGPAPRRMPGGVTRRTAAAPPPPGSPPAQPPPEQPSAAQESPAAAAPQGSTPQQSRPRGPAEPGGEPQRRPDGQRSKRRRPPPWMRNRTTPPGGGDGPSQG